MEERGPELQAAGAAWAKTCDWLGRALGGRTRLGYEEPGQHCSSKSESRTGTLASVAEGSFHTHRVTQKGEHLGQRDQQQGQGEEASTWVEAQGMGRRGADSQHLG